MKILDLPHHLLPRSLRDLSSGKHSVESVSDTISDTIQRAFASAGLDARSGAFKTTSDTINSALSAAGLMPATAPVAEGQRTVIEGEARVIDTEDVRPGRTIVDERSHGGSGGELRERSFTNHAGSRDYKLYVPSSYSASSDDSSVNDHAGVPLVVMLHGCTQSAEDFAAGTRMNALAERHGFLVAWPVQPSNANHSRCWNWFRPQDQSRDRGEPALIAGITREIAASYRVDARRIFVAGLSAGAAMAVILGATYPELYAAVGAHSGLPHGVAHDLPSALAAMRGGQPQRNGPGTRGPATATEGATANASATMSATISATSSATVTTARSGVPVIVFHGDRDQTVHVRNGEVILDEALAARADRSQLRVELIEGTSDDGRAYVRAIHRDAAGYAVAEAWTLRGAGHAWSGGSAGGSFADARGPDASAEMIRFFFDQPRTGTA